MNITIHVINNKFVVFDTVSVEHLSKLCISTYNISPNRATTNLHKQRQLLSTGQINNNHDIIEEHVDNTNIGSYNQFSEYADERDDDHTSTTKTHTDAIRLPCYILPVYAHYLHYMKQAQLVTIDQYNDNINKDDVIQRRQHVANDKIEYDRQRDAAQQRRLQYITPTTGTDDTIINDTNVNRSHNSVGRHNTLDYSMNLIHNVLDECNIDRTIIDQSTYHIAYQLQSDPLYHNHYFLYNQYINHTPYIPYQLNQSDISLSHCRVISSLIQQDYWCTSGVTYGADYLVYHNNPSLVHAAFICIVIDNNIMTAQHLIAANRLAGAVNKAVLLAYVSVHNNHDGGSSSDRVNNNDNVPWNNYHVQFYTVQFDSFVSTNKT